MFVEKPDLKYNLSGFIFIYLFAQNDS
jgi:hypothetical protein